MALNYSKQYTFSPNTTILSSQVNTNFDDIGAVFTGLEAGTKSFTTLKIDDVNAAITPASAGATATSTANRLAQVINQIKTGFGLTNWYDTVERKGQILQLVTATSTTSFSTTSTSFQNTNLSASITPTYSTSKIIVLACAGFRHNAAVSGQGYITLLRDSTNLAGSDGIVSTQANGADVWGNGTVLFVDAPGDTSAHTYRVAVRTSSSSNTVAYGYSANQTQFIVLAEVKL